jgi:hypothetical protein
MCDQIVENPIFPGILAPISLDFAAYFYLYFGANFG